MSSERRSGGGAAFVLLLSLGFVIMFWWIFAIMLGLLLLSGLAFYAAHRVDERHEARLAIAARADEQHVLVLAGDDRGIYGEYTPKQID
jgi:hypothetical protein